MRKKGIRGSMKTISPPNALSDDPFLGTRCGPILVGASGYPSPSTWSRGAHPERIHDRPHPGFLLGRLPTRTAMTQGRGTHAQKGHTRIDEDDFAAQCLIGFPSFLGHSVRAYLGRSERISIAINMVARRAPSEVR
jgi:hypothetical protein